MSKKRKDCIEEILSSKANLHVSEIAKLLLDKRYESDIAIDDLVLRVNGILARDVKKSKGSIFRRIKNKKGGYKRGVYGLRQKKVSTQAKMISKMAKNLSVNVPTISTSFSGKAGEYAVLSELLFHGFNASIMSVDDGIDIVASKGSDFFYIQVKTASNKANKFHSAIKSENFKKWNRKNTFYIFVLRFLIGGTVRNSFVIFNSSDIERYVETHKVQNGNNLNFNIEMLVEGRALLNEKEDITYFFNNFGYIK